MVNGEFMREGKRAHVNSSSPGNPNKLTKGAKSEGARAVNLVGSTARLLGSDISERRFLS